MIESCRVCLHLGYSYTLGMNQFGDINREEFSRFVAGVKRNPRSSHEAKLGVKLAWEH